MRIRRIRLVLPARMRATATADARAIAEAAAVALEGRGAQAGPLTVQGAGRPAHGLAREVAARLGPGPRARGD